VSTDEVTGAGSLAALLDEIIRSPDDMELRLAYADAVESADPERAELIRIQVRTGRSRGAHWPPDRRAIEEAPLYGREQGMVNRRGREWAGDLAGLVNSWHYLRGFPEEIAIDAADFLARAPELYRRTPVLHLNLHRRSDSEVCRRVRRRHPGGGRPAGKVRPAGMAERAAQSGLAAIPRRRLETVRRVVEERAHLVARMHEDPRGCVRRAEVVLLGSAARTDRDDQVAAWRQHLAESGGHVAGGSGIGEMQHRRHDHAGWLGQVGFRAVRPGGGGRWLLLRSGR
jgi:uncharacterized protein (TIGR02996 family)